MTLVPCSVCDQPVDTDDAHYPHPAGRWRADCPWDCDCDYPTHPECCPTCRPPVEATA